MNLFDLAEQLKSGAITIAEWESAMRDYLREQYTAAMILAKGGRDNITQSDWGYMGSSLKKQYAYLDGFAKDIQSNPEAWLNGRLNNRMNLYKESAYAALEEFNRREAMEQGFDEERRVLGAADHCNGCLEQAAQGWQPIGTLDPIGAEDCVTNCKCEFEFRKTGGVDMFQTDGSTISSDNTPFEKQSYLDDLKGELNYNGKIMYHSGLPSETIDGLPDNAGAAYSPDGTIHVWDNAFNSGESLKGILAHEVTHGLTNLLDQKQIHRIFLDEYTLKTGISTDGMKWIGENELKFIMNDDAFTSYSQKVWIDVMIDEAPAMRGLKETLSEIARIDIGGATTNKDISDLWRSAYDKIIGEAHDKR